MPGPRARAAPRRGRARRPRSRRGRPRSRETRLLGDQVDRRRLQLDDADVGVDPLEISPQDCRSARFRDAATTSSRWSSRAAAGGEDGGPAAGERLDRLAAADRTGSRAGPSAPAAAATSSLIVRTRSLISARYGLRPEFEVVGDQDPRAGGDRRDRGAAAVEDDQVGRAAGGQAGALEHVRDERSLRRARRRSGGSRRSARLRAPRSRGGPRRRGGRRASGPGGRRAVGADLDHLGLGRAAAPHRDDDDVALRGRAAGRGGR